MRARWARVLAGLCAAGTATVLLSTPPPATAAAPSTSPSTTPLTAPSTTATSAPGPAADRDASLELRDLFVSRDQLGLMQRYRAAVLLARPTDGAADRGGDGYRRPSRRSCAAHVCVHRVRHGADAATAGWARRTLHVMEQVWRHETGTLGFRSPPSDGRRGGDGRFDVYLADLGARGLFGYCTPERRVPGERSVASGYCVLDNDFAREQFGTAPRRSLRVTAAHEFFHAVQFGYDFREDPWLMESTAVWVEETFADAADDNRRYLRFGALRRPWVPLDTYSNAGYAQYGNWAFWEFAERRYGPGLVRAVWRRAAALQGAADQSSVGALRAVLDRRSGATGTLRTALSAFAVANLAPARVYPEGDQWPAARTGRATTLARAGDTGVRRLAVDHLAAEHVALRPVTGPTGRAWRRTRGWRLEIGVRMPRRAAVVVTVRHRDGPQRSRMLTARRSSAVVAFDGAGVEDVVVTAVNASARYRCGRVTLWACGGVPRDDDARFVVRYAVRR